MSARPDKERGESRGLACGMGTNVKYKSNKQKRNKIDEKIILVFGIRPGRL